MKLSSIGAGYRRALLPIFLIVMAAILLVIGLVMSSNNNKEYLETTATIVNIDEENLKTIISYVVNGVNYNNVELNAFDSSYSVGQVINILYNPADPTIVVIKHSTFLIVLLYAGAIVLLAGGVASIYFAIKSAKKGKDLSKKPVIVSDNRALDEMKKLYFSLDTYTHVKLRFFIEDENKNVLYEGKMIKHNLVGPHTYLFTDNVNHTEVEHKVGHVNQAESGSVTVSQGFTFDGVEIVKYFDANNIRINHGVSKHGLTYTIYHEDRLVATAVSSSRYVHEEDAEKHPVGSHFRLNQYFYQIEGFESYLDVIFIVLFKEALSPRLESVL